MLYTNNCYPTITKPTRITDHSATLIDHIYTNSCNSISTIMTVDISDHLPVFCLVDTDHTKNNSCSTYRDYSNFNQSQYLKDLQQVNWNDCYNSNSNLNITTNNFLNTIKQLIDRHARLKQISRSKIKQLKKPWLTKGLLQSIKNKQKMYKTHFLKCNDPQKIAKYKKIF